MKEMRRCRQRRQINFQFQQGWAFAALQQHRDAASDGFGPFSSFSLFDVGDPFLCCSPLMVVVWFVDRSTSSCAAILSIAVARGCRFFSIHEGDGGTLVLIQMLRRGCVVVMGVAAVVLASWWVYGRVSYGWWWPCCCVVSTKIDDKAAIFSFSICTLGGFRVSRSGGYGDLQRLFWRCW
ncbi:Hypothetical predicted protein [Olea europaea subsp. europaea]|uniref:Transmembrane protein n=1 Tax=Olea europaea subsp. europaea TaxID=158383 RepID=A0A8S0SM41_OLEEU|nr:Hypothetical predicted protein [Olea europaea subsp. europaea]